MRYIQSEVGSIVKEATKGKLRKYKVLRLLQTGEKRYSYLESHYQEKRVRLIQTLEKLKTFNDIRKKKIYLKNDEDVEISTANIIAGIWGVEPKTDKRYTTLYSITKQGLSKLCFYEYFYGMHYLWVPPGLEGKYQKNYEQTMALEIEKQTFYRKKKGLI